jgi:glycosyltransferase involved in cell wall biosynthesis
MKIVILNAGVRGPASYSLNLYKYLTSKGHKVLFITEAKWEKEKIPLYQAQSYKVLGLAPLVYNPGDLIKKIKDFSPDIIHHHWPCGTMDVLFGMIMKLKIPTIVTVHVAINSRKFLWDKLFYVHFTLFKTYLKKMDAVISISKFVKKQVKDRTKIPDSKHHLIYAGVNTEIFKPMDRTEEIKNRKELNILFIGQIMPEKGIDVLVDAVIEISKRRDVRLTIIGTGHLKPILQKKTEGMPFINWVGFLKEQKQIAKYYSEADMTVLPTKWDEAFSLVPVESLACGTPVLSTAKGGTPEVVIPDKTGYLIKSCNKISLKRKLLSIDKKELEKMRAGCREFALENYTLEKWGKDHEELYKKIIEEKK